MSSILIGFICYLVLMLGVGFATYKMNKTQADFLLAGRKLPTWVATLSERASGESAWLLLGLPGAAMAVGLFEFWTVIGCVSGIAASWWIIASGLRRETERHQALTLPEYLAKRFGDQAQLIRLLAAAIIIFFYSFYVAAQFNGAGKVLLVTFGIPEMWGTVLGASIIIVYTMMGGFFAVAWTDVVQALIMIGTLVILPLVGIIELSQQGLSIGGALEQGGATMSSWTGGKVGWAAVVAIMGGLSWGFGYLGQPHTLTRYMSVANVEGLKKGRFIAFAWAAPAFVGAFFIGVVGLGLYEQGHFSDPEQLMPTLATELLPGWLAGVFISGAIAAMMSTADSQLLVGTSAIAEDVMHKAMGKKLEPKALVALSRVVTVALGAIGVALALTSGKLIFALVSYAWSGLGSSFGPAILLTLHWKKTTGWGVFCGMLAGALTTVIWSNIEILNAAVSVRVTSFVFAILAIVVVSLLTQKAGKTQEA